MVTVLVGHAIRSAVDWVAYKQQVSLSPFWRPEGQGQGAGETVLEGAVFWFADCQLLIVSSLGRRTASWPPPMAHIHSSELHPLWPPKGLTPKDHHLGNKASVYEFAGRGRVGGGEHSVHTSHQNVIRIDLNPTWFSAFFSPRRTFSFFSDQCRDKNPEAPEHPLFDTFLI